MADTGDVRFAIDLSKGLVHVTVRPPLALESSAVTAHLSVLTFLDFAARATLELNKAQREAMAALGRGELAQQFDGNGVRS